MVRTSIENNRTKLVKRVHYVTFHTKRPNRTAFVIKARAVILNGYCLLRVLSFINSARRQATPIYAFREGQMERYV